MEWSPELIDAIRHKVFDERKTAQAVANELSNEIGIRVTRNAVIGKINRMRVRRPPSLPKPSPNTIGLGLKILQLEHGQCRWIEEGGICGLPTVDKGSWCSHHRRRVFL
jgi:hypothetical protein